jgi:acetyl-CoA C-acetyltransferase
MAGIKNPRKELDVAEVYNPFTFQELLYYECFGFCDFGTACDYTLKGVFSREGELPCDPSGGTLCTNPIGATGLNRVAEAALQVTNQAGASDSKCQNGTGTRNGRSRSYNGVMIVSSVK